jgi:hypothetical protein
MSDTPETDAFFFRTDIEWDDEVGFARKLERERDQYRSKLELIAEDCEAWLKSESDEPSAEFIKLVAKYARKAIKCDEPHAQLANSY